MILLIWLNIDIYVRKEEVLIDRIYTDWWCVPFVTENGRYLLFNGKFDRDRTDDIWCYDLARGRVELLIESEDQMTAPSYNRKSRRLYFQSYCEDSDSYEIFAYIVSTGEFVRLTDNSYYNGFARSSPEGDRVVYVEEHLEKDKVLLALDTEQGVRVVRLYPSSYLDEAFHPSFDVRGNRVVFISKSYGDSYGVYVLDLNDTTLIKVVDESDNPLYYPSMSPDGRYVCFENDYNGAVYIASVETGEVKRLTEEDNYTFPWWSPDGGVIYCFRYRKEDGDKVLKLVKLTLGGGDVRTVEVDRRAILPLRRFPVVFSIDEARLPRKGRRFEWEVYDAGSTLVVDKVVDRGGRIEKVEDEETVTKVTSKDKKDGRKRVLYYIAIFIISGLIIGVYFLIRLVA